MRTNPPKIANKQNYEQTGVSEIRKSWWILVCYPVLSLNGLKLCKLVSRFDPVLIPDQSLDFFGTNLILQVCISLCSVSDKSGAFLLQPGRIKMPLLICNCCILQLIPKRKNFPNSCKRFAPHWRRILFVNLLAQTIIFILPFPTRTERIFQKFFSPRASKHTHTPRK